MNSVPFKPAAAVYATSVANSTKPIPLDLPSNSFKIFTLLTVPAFEKKVFKSPSVALNEIFFTTTSNVGSTTFGFSPSFDSSLT